VSVACTAAPPPVEIELTSGPTILSTEPRSFRPARPLPADNVSVGLCVDPGPGHAVTGRWTVRTPAGREAQVVARAELVSGDVVRLVSPSSNGPRLCVHPRRGGPLDAPVRSLTVVASTPIAVERLVWRSTAR